MALASLPRSAACSGRLPSTCLPSRMPSMASSRLLMTLLSCSTWSSRTFTCSSSFSTRLLCSVDLVSASWPQVAPELRLSLTNLLARRGGREMVLVAGPPAGPPATCSVLGGGTLLYAGPPGPPGPPGLLVSSFLVLLPGPMASLAGPGPWLTMEVWGPGVGLPAAVGGGWVALAAARTWEGRATHGLLGAATDLHGEPGA